MLTAPSIDDLLARRSYALPTIAESLATPLSDDVLFNWHVYAEKIPPSVSIEHLAWDLRRRCGAERGYELYEPLVLEWGNIETIDAQWAACVRPECEGDQHIIHELASLHNSGKLLDIMLPDDGWAVRNELDALARRFDTLHFEMTREAFERIRSDRGSLFSELREKFKELEMAQLARYTKSGKVPMPANLSIVLAAPLPALIKTSAEFVGDFVPPEYLLDGVLQRRYFYSLTANTGVGKTAIAMRWMAHVVSGRQLVDKEVQQGAVLYFAGENPDDVRARWLVLARDMGMDPSNENAHFIVGAMDLSQVAQRISTEVSAKGLRLTMVVVDTAAAYNFGDDENSNTQAGNYARQLRSLTELPGGPCVVVLCHPTKRAGDDDLLPRGGGAFLAEVDGNLAAMKKDSLLAVVAQGKFRGDASFTLRYELEVVRDHPKLVDARGRHIPSVIAKPVGDANAAALETRTDHDNEMLLRAVSNTPGATPTDLARSLGWTYGPKADPNNVKVSRALKRLLKEKLVIERLGAWRTTQTGDKELNAIDTARPALPFPSAS